MVKKEKYLIGMFVLVVLGLSVFASAYYSYSNPTYSSLAPGSFSSTVPDETCNEGQDFLLQLSPLGCSPAVVRTDLLAEQNVPVFCPIAAIKINPLIDVDVVESISFSGQYPKEVSGVAFHPAQSALGSQNNINTPVDANIGYAVIVLKKQKNSSAVPEFLKFNMTARLRYDIKSAFGVGQANFYVPEISDEAWDRNYGYYSFWNKRGFLKTELVEDETATISVYSENTLKLATVKLKKGETSRRISIPGWDCLLGVQVKLNGVVNPDTVASLRVNADEVQIKKGSKFLDNKCTILEMDKYGLMQVVEISCSEDEKPKKFSLTISPRVSLTIGETKGSYELGDKLPITGAGVVYYLGFIGGLENIGNGEIVERDNVKHLSVFIYGVPEKNSVGDKLDAEKIEYVSRNAYNKLELKVREGKYPEDEDSGWWIEGKGKKKTIDGEDVIFNGFADANNGRLGLESQQNYDNAMKDIRAILDSYVNVKKGEKGESTYGEEALKEAIKISKDSGQNKKVVEFCDELKDTFPGKGLPDLCNNNMLLSSSGISGMSVLINGKTSMIYFDGIVEPRFFDYGVEINIDTTPYSLKKDEKVFLKTEKEGVVSGQEYIQLIDLEKDEAKFRINFLKADEKGKGVEKKEYVTQTITIKTNKIDSFGTLHNVYLNKIHLNKVADISVLPSIDNADSESSFMVGIGIEKRAIELSPEWTKKKIASLNKSIAKWEDRSEKLGTVIKGLKGACLGVGAALTVKNFFSGLSGASIARRDVMNTRWKQECATNVSGGVYKNLDVCYLKNADEIDSDVATRQKEIKEYNERIKILQDNPDITKKNFWGKVVDDEKLSVKYYPNPQKRLAQQGEGILKDPSGKGEPIDVKEGSAVFGAFDIKKMSMDEARTIDGYLTTIENSATSDGFRASTKEALYAKIVEINNREAASHQATTLATLTDTPSKAVGVINQKNVKTVDLTGSYFPSNAEQKANYGGVEFKKDKARKDITKGIYVYQAPLKGDKTYLSTYNAHGVVQKTYVQDKVERDPSGTVTKISWKELKDKEEKGVPNPFGLKFNTYTGESYNNQYKSSYSDPSGPVVRYHETAPYKGLPAIVPFDLQNGWYAATRQVLPTFGKIGTYDDSGRVVSFYVCNIGKNGREEFQITGDDICQQINTGTGQSYNAFHGLSASEASRIIRCGQQAIEEASKAYKKGIKNVRIRTSCGTESLSVGKPAFDIPEMQCQDIMSPKDCALLFNVCDPVICPASRCDFGGSFPVQDPVQSGIIGSLLLCLPNFKGFGGDVWIPICLTGLKAGIDGLLSVFKSYRDCLQQNLDTGEMIGICDEIYSVHLCEFFWRQGLPLAKVAVPKMFEMLLGQSSRGGGEYRTVEAAWQNAEASKDYFTGYYAANAWKSFAARSQDTEQIGTEICKNFASANYGLDLDKLTDPDSPPQFHGRFDEIPFTTATNPPTSQYKVFYHIYSGKDSQVYYRVYLKGTPGSSYYQEISSSRVVASGYIGKNDYASETKDFTAPSGYKELCINVNGQEECGFKQVSTSMAVDYVKDMYMKEIATDKDIASEKECVSGSPSMYSALNLNVQEGASEILSPAIYKRGIIRICSTHDPGEGTDARAGSEGARWVKVGNCGTEKIGCWLDTESVKNVVHDSDIENNTLQEVGAYNMKILQEQGGYMDKTQYKNFILELDAEKDPGKKIEMINNNMKKAFYNAHKAELFLQRAIVYGMLASKEYKKRVENEGKVNVVEKGGEEKYCGRFDFIISPVQKGAPPKLQVVANGEKCKDKGVNIKVTTSDASKTIVVEKEVSFVKNENNYVASVELSDFKINTEYSVVVSADAGVFQETALEVKFTPFLWTGKEMKFSSTGIVVSGEAEVKVVEEDLESSSVEKAIFLIRADSGFKNADFILINNEIFVQEEVNLATAFLVKKEESKTFFITAFHALAIEEGKPKSKIFFKDTSALYAVKIEKDKLKKQDIVLISSLHVPQDLKPLSLGDSSILMEGDGLFTFGYPVDFQSTSKTEYTLQKSSGKYISKELKKEYPFKLIKTDIKVAPGYSGAPVFNEKKEVVGVIIVMGRKDSYAWIVPINLIKERFGL